MVIKFSRKSSFLCFIVFLSFPFLCQSARTLTQNDLKGIINRVPTIYYCIPNIEKNSLEAYEANQEKVEALSKLDYKTTDTDQLKELYRVTSILKIAEAIDEAILQRDYFSKYYTKGVFGSAYKSNKEHIESIALKDWRNDQLNEVEGIALNMCQRAYLIDITSAYKLASKTKKSSNFDAAYTKNESHINSIVSKKWEKDEFSDSEFTALNILKRAYLIDIAVAFQSTEKNFNTKYLKDLYITYKQSIESIASKSYEKDELSKEEVNAICQLIKEYLKS